ncbi:unnamed protein product [Calicophoron daubneyi]|uniref:EF-hand domain-containing protein n=1 Tax=Calicophoron daubneyi TaxID=300641 RepID=A0AAV2SYQ8_CALDB
MENAQSSNNMVMGSASSSELKLSLSIRQKQDILEAFTLLDTEGTGLVRVRELKVALRALGFEPTASELRCLMQEYDKENRGVLDFCEFLNIISRKMTEKDTSESFLKSFKLFDDNDTGRITLQNLKQAAELLGEDITDEELQVWCRTSVEKVNTSRNKTPLEHTSI